MDQMDAEAAALAQEADTFERISAELKAMIAVVEYTAGSLAGRSQGQNGGGAQSALQRFRAAADRQVRELNEILGNIHASGVHYPTPNGTQISSL